MSFQLLTLTVILAKELADNNDGFIGVTPSILEAGQEKALDNFPDEYHPSVGGLLKDLKNQLGNSGLIDLDSDTWDANRFDLSDPADRVALKVQAEQADKFIVVPRPVTLPGWMAQLDVEVITIHEMFYAAHHQAKIPTRAAVLEHMKALVEDGWTKEEYKTWLVSEKLEHLTVLLE